jgi:hypothetical protein
MTEEEIHRHVVAHLRRAGLQDWEFFHSPNEGRCSPRMASRRKAMGVNAGVPDLIMIRPPTRVLVDIKVAGTLVGTRNAVAAALELKSETGRLTPAQKLWLANAAANGWAVAVTKGLDAALAQLRTWGYL